MGHNKVIFIGILWMFCYNYYILTTVSSIHNKKSTIFKKKTENWISIFWKFALSICFGEFLDLVTLNRHKHRKTVKIFKCIDSVDRGGKLIFVYIFH